MEYVLRKFMRSLSITWSKCNLDILLLNMFFLSLTLLLTQRKNHSHDKDETQTRVLRVLDSIASHRSSS